MVKRFLVSFATVLLLSVDGWGCAAHEPVPVGSTFASLEPELDAYVDAMAVRLARATGRHDVAASPDGAIPVYFLDGMTSVRPDTGEVVEDCGNTLWRSQDGVFVSVEIRIDPTPAPNCPPIQVTLLHEGMHGLAPDAAHADRGVFAEAAQGSRVDMPALERVCSSFECLTMTVE